MVSPPLNDEVERFETVRLVREVVPAERFPEKVDVEFVPRTSMKPWKVEVPAVRPWMVVDDVVPKIPRLPPKSLAEISPWNVVVPVPTTARFVVVAEVPVAFLKTMSWKVDEERTKRLAN